MHLERGSGHKEEVARVRRVSKKEMKQGRETNPGSRRGDALEELDVGARREEFGGRQQVLKDFGHGDLMRLKGGGLPRSSKLPAALRLVDLTLAVAPSILSVAPSISNEVSGNAGRAARRSGIVGLFRIIGVDVDRSPSVLRNVRAKLMGSVRRGRRLRGTALAF